MTLKLSSSLPCPELRLLDSRRQLCGRIRVSAVTQHHVQENDRNLRIGGFLCQPFDPQIIVHHGVKATDRKLIFAQIDDRVLDASGGFLQH